MSDQSIMENLILTTKGVCDLYLHGAIESGTKNVHNAFDGALRQSLSMQDGLYQHMEQKGWYTESQASQQHIDTVRNKFAGVQ